MRFTSRIPDPSRQTSVRQAGPGTCLLIALIGVALLCGSFYTAQNVRNLTANGLHVEGEVLDMRQEIKTGTRTQNGVSVPYNELVYHTIVRFADASGKNVTFEDNATSTFPAHIKGDKVNVIYLPENAARSATIDKGIGNWGFPIGLGAVGFLFLVFALAAYLLRPREQKNQTTPQ